MEALPSSGIPPPQPPQECATFILFSASTQELGILKLRGALAVGLGAGGGLGVFFLQSACGAPHPHCPSWFLTHGPCGAW